MKQIKREITIFYLKISVLILIIIISIYFKFSNNSLFINIKNNLMLKINFINSDKNLDKKTNNDTKLPTFDLTFFYQNPNDPKIDEDIQEITLKIKEFQENYKIIGKLNKNAFYQSIKDYEYLCYKISCLGIYSYLLISTDSASEENNKLYSKVQEKKSNWFSAINYYNLEISNLSNEKINYFLSDKRIVFYAPFIDDITKYKHHRLSNELEQFSIEKNGATNATVLKYYDNKLSSLRFNYKNKDYNLSEIIELLNDKDQKVRHEVGVIFNNGLGSYIDEFTFVFNYFLKSKGVDDKWAKYKTPIDAELIANNMTMKDLDSMVDTVQKNYNNLNRYYTLKAKALKLKKLTYFDRNVDLIENQAKYNWQDAENIVLDTFAYFSPQMGEMAKSFFTNKRIDAEIKKSKRSGGFCTTGESFVFINFANNLNSVTTLAHEIGHGIQMTLSKQKYGILMDSAPLNLAEVASTFGEALVYNSIIENTTDNLVKISILSKKIEGALNSILRQTSFHIFEKKIHEARLDHELTSRELSEIWTNSIKESLGECFEINNDISNIWSYIAHFIHHPFYVYSYAFSDMITYTLYAKYKQAKTDNERADFANKYVDFITDMTTIKYDELLKRFDLDVNDANFWQNAIDEIISNINTLEELMKQERLI